MFMYEPLLDVMLTGTSVDEPPNQGMSISFRIHTYDWMKNCILYSVTGFFFTNIIVVIFTNTFSRIRERCDFNLCNKSIKNICGKRTRTLQSYIPVQKMSLLLFKSVHCGSTSPEWHQKADFGKIIPIPVTLNCSAAAQEDWDSQNGTGTQYSSKSSNYGVQ